MIEQPEVLLFKVEIVCSNTDPFKENWKLNYCSGFQIILQSRDDQKTNNQNNNKQI